MKHVHDAPTVMSIPLIILALGAVVTGFFFAEYFIGHHQAEFWQGSIFTLSSNHILEESHHVPTWVKWSPLIVTVLGFLIAYLFYVKNPGVPRRMGEKPGFLHTFLIKKWYFDELYNAIFVRPALWLGRFLWKRGDEKTIDGVGPDGVAARVLDTTRAVVRLQSGYLYHYAFAMLIGIAALVTYFTLMRGQ